MVSQAVRQLLAAGVSPGEENRAGVTPLLLACQQGHADIARVLCDHDAELARPTSECSPLYAAAEHGHAGVARLLLGLAAAEAPSWRGNGGLAPLHAACLAGHQGVVSLLCHDPHVAAARPWNAAADGGLTPLHIGRFLHNRHA